MSAFLAVLLSIILLFQSTFYSLTGYAGAEAMLQRLLDQSAYSVLADFDGQVKNKYGLYMLYQDGTSLEYQLSDYLTENLGYESEFGLLDVRLQDMDTEQKGFSYLSLLEKQILDYCQYRIPLATVEGFLSRADGILNFLQENDDTIEWKESFPSETYNPEQTYETERYEQFDMRQEAQEQLTHLLNTDTEATQIPTSVYRMLPSQKLSYSHWNLDGLLETFLSVDFEAEDAMDTVTCCVNDLPFENIGNALYEDYLINEYILQVLNHTTNLHREGSYLQWEVEYIIFGNRSDTANREYMQILLLLVRFILNTLYLYSQNDMVTTAEIASYLATLLASFQGQPAVKQGILLAWSFMESWNDYELLSKGTAVPVYKTEETWKYWFSYDKDAAGKTLSLYYEDYLRIFLLLIPREVRLARILDLIQLNESQSNASFQVLNSVTQFRVSITCYYNDKQRWPLEVEGIYAY